MQRRAPYKNREETRVLTVVMELVSAMTGLGALVLFTGEAAWGEGGWGV